MSISTHATHVKAEALEVWVSDKLQALVLGDAAGANEAIERFVVAISERSGSSDVEPLHRELAKIDSTVNALLTGTVPANLPLLNDRLTQLRRRKEHLQEQKRAAETTSLDEKTLRKWAGERIGMLREICAGRRDEKARQVLASYVDKNVIELDTKPATTPSTPRAAPRQKRLRWPKAQTTRRKAGRRLMQYRGHALEPTYDLPTWSSLAFRLGSQGVRDGV